MNIDPSGAYRINDVEQNTVRESNKEEPRLGEYRAIKDTNNVTGRVRWVLCTRIQKSDGKPYWERIESYKSRRKAQKSADAWNAKYAWVLDSRETRTP